MKKKWLSYALAGALTLGAIGGVGATAQAATSSASPKWTENLDAATKEKVEAIMQSTKEKLEKLGIEMPEKGFGKQGEKGPFANLDEATKAKAKAIMHEVKAGTITEDEAKTKLAALGIEMPEKGFGKQGEKGPFANLDAATKEKVKAIMDDMKAGTITEEEAQTKLANLGVELPDKGFGKHGGKDPFANLDTDTKAQAKEIMDDMKEQLDELGVQAPQKGGRH